MGTGRSPRARACGRLRSAASRSPTTSLKARSQFARKEIDRARSCTELERKATKEWIEFQDSIDTDLVVDGEQYRGDMVAYFAEELPGLEIGGLVRSYGNRYYRKPIATGPIGREKPITVEWWKFAQSLTDKPVKGMLTGPYTIWTGRSTSTTRPVATSCSTSRR